MKILLCVVTILIAYPLGTVFGMLVVSLIFWCRKETQYIKPAFKAEIWKYKHPIKSIKLTFDEIVVCCMRLDDKIFKKMLMHKYKNNQKRMNRVVYETEDEKKWMEMTMKPFGQVLECTYRSLNISSPNMYAPRRVIYEDYERIWQIGRE